MKELIDRVQPLKRQIAEKNDQQAQGTMKQLQQIEQTLNKGHVDGSGCTNAAFTTAFIRNKTGTQKQDIIEALERIQPQIAAVKAGDLSGLEEMLTGQAIGLQAIYNHAVMLGIACQSPENVDRFMHLALRSQEQCRKTILAINELKNPKRAVFIKNQAQQQVNQFALTQDPSKNTDRQLEASPYAQAMDFRTEATPAGADPTVETVGEINRASDPSRKRSRKPKRASTRLLQP